MQVALNAKQIEIVQQIIGDEGLRKCVYTCEECVHYCPHYVPQAPMNIAPYKKLNIGHCAKKQLLIKKNKGACAGFELKEDKR